MTLIEQVFSDLRKEIGWVLFYGVLTTVVLMSFILFGLTTGDMISRSEALGRFVAEDISMARLHSIRFNISPKSDPAQDAPEEKESWDTYCTDVFSESGNAGTYVIMPGRDGYQLIILLLGIYADLTPFSRPQSEAVTFAISYDQKEKKGDNISVEGKQFPLYLAPADMEIFHPLRYINGKFGTLDNTLYVFSRDLKAVQEIFPPYKYWELEGNAYFDWLIFRSPTAQDIIRLRNVVSENFGEYVSIRSTLDYLRNSSEPGVRTHQTSLLFYLIAALALLSSLILNLYQVLKRKIPDYAVHRLFGASDAFLYARMLLFALFYHAIPLLGTIYVVTVNRMATPATLMAAAVVLLASLLGVTGAVHKQFCTQFSRELRRE